MDEVQKLLFKAAMAEERGEFLATVRAVVDVMLKRESEPFGSHAAIRLLNTARTQTSPGVMALIAASELTEEKAKEHLEAVTAEDMKGLRNAIASWTTAEKGNGSADRSSSSPVRQGSELTFGDDGTAKITFRPAGKLVEVLTKLGWGRADRPLTEAERKEFSVWPPIGHPRRQLYEHVARLWRVTTWSDLRLTTAPTECEALWRAIRRQRGHQYIHGGELLNRLFTTEPGSPFVEPVPESSIGWPAWRDLTSLTAVLVTMAYFTPLKTAAQLRTDFAVHLARHVGLTDMSLLTAAELGKLEGNVCATVVEDLGPELLPVTATADAAASPDKRPRSDGKAVKDALPKRGPGGAGPDKVCYSCGHLAGAPGHPAEVVKCWARQLFHVCALDATQQELKALVEGRNRTAPRLVLKEE
jgi:hypothetical protein